MVLYPPHLPRTPHHAYSLFQVPGSTTVRTYLQESLGFLSEQPKDGDWLAGSSSAAGGGIGVGLGGKGPSLGMAFLSGMCGAARPRPEFEPESDRGEGVVDGSQGCFGESMVIMDMDGIPTRERPGGVCVFLCVCATKHLVGT